jgi:hypothetical protein
MVEGVREDAIAAGVTHEPSGGGHARGASVGRAAPPPEAHTPLAVITGGEASYDLSPTPRESDDR